MKARLKTSWIVILVVLALILGFIIGKKSLSFKHRHKDIQSHELKKYF